MCVNRCVHPLTREQVTHTHRHTRTLKMHTTHNTQQTSPPNKGEKALM